MELSPTLQIIADAHIRGTDALFLEGLVEGAGMLGLLGTEAKLISFAEQWQGKPNANPEAVEQPTRQAGFDEARQAGELAGATIERNRIKAILTDPLATDRADAAHHLAFGTDLTPAQALALLATVQPGTAAQALQSIPATIARACHAEGGLIAFDAALGAIAPVEAGGRPKSASIGFAPAPDPFQQSDPKAKALASWKRTTDALNAEADHAIRA
jgi:hypothetical protein